MVHLPTVDCPVCGRTAKIGLPRGADVTSITSDRPGDGMDGLGRKVRRLACPDGHEFYVCFAPAAGPAQALESGDDGGTGDTEVGE